MKLSLVIPTVDGRGHWLRRSLKAFEETTPVPYETLVYENLPTCGIAWNRGIEDAKGEYVLLSADDLEPLPGWWEAGLASLELSRIPSARILNSDGSLQCMGDWIVEIEEGAPCELSRIPFAPRQLMQDVYPIIETHYATDNYFSLKAAEHGWPSHITRGFCFYHHWAEQGRLDCLQEDLDAFEKATGRRLVSTL